MDLKTNGHNFLDVPQSALRSANSFVVTLDSPATEFIPSWTGQTPEGSEVAVFLKPLPTVGPSYCLGRWSQKANRSSVNDQKDERGQVATDTLILNAPADHIEIQIKTTGSAQLESLRMVANTPDAAQDDHSRGPIATLPVPQRAQMSYPGGNVLCSPTSVSMLTAYWASVLVRPELDHDVPKVQAGVYDPAWHGTGNWSFNTAFAGSLPGMTGYVTRLRGISDAEEWLKHKVPLVCSVSYAMLKGADKPADNDGHIVVLVGINENGDPVFNDPGRNAVRMTYKRADFARAWAKSNRTVYLIYPKLWRTPDNGPWPTRKNR